VVIAASALAAVRHLEAHPELVALLHQNTRYFREQLIALGFQPIPGETPIVPVILGETAKAIVVKVPDTDVTEAEIIAYAKERLATFKCPTSVDWADVLPRNPSGKVLKKDLREPYWEGRSRNVN